MNRQSYLTRGPSPADAPMDRRPDGATVKYFTHVNKGKVYPYSSERQNTRAKWRRERAIPRVGEFYADYSPLTPEEIAAPIRGDAISEIGFLP